MKMQSTRKAGLFGTSEACFEARERRPVGARSPVETDAGSTPRRPGSLAGCGLVTGQVFERVLGGLAVVLGALWAIWLGPVQALGDTAEQEFRIYSDMILPTAAGTENTAASGGGKWKNVLENPVAVPVKFAGAFDCQGRVRIVLAGVSVSDSNTNVVTCNDPDSTLMTDPRTALLSIYTTYDLILESDPDGVVYQAWADLSPPTLTDLLQGVGRNAQQYNRYNIYVRKKGEAQWKKLCSSTKPYWNCESDGPGYCTAMSVTYEVQVRPDMLARPPKRPRVTEAGGEDQVDDSWDRDEPAIDAKVAPGDGIPLSIGPSKSAEATSISVSWGAELGRKWDGGSAGKLRLNATALTTNVFTPLALTYVPRSDDTNEIDVLYSLTRTNEMSQVKTPQTLVTITNLSANSFELKFYTASQVGPRDGAGFFTLVTGASNFVTWRFDSPGGSTNSLRVQEIRNGVTSASQVQWQAGAPQWTLTRGTGSEARIETRTVSVWQAAGVTNRLEIQEVKDGANTVCDKTSELYRSFPWGFELVTVTNDPGGLNLITTFDYQSDTNYPGAFGKLIAAAYPDGFWERREYSETTDIPTMPREALYRIIQPWKNIETNADLGDCLVTEFRYLEGFGEGSFQMQRWHDAARFDEPEDGSEAIPYRWRSSVYEEETLFDQAECDDLDLVEESRQFGDLDRFGERILTKSYGAAYGRLAGHVYSKQAQSGPLAAYDYLFGDWNVSTFTFTPEPNGSATNDTAQVIYHGAVDAWGDLFLTGDQIAYSESWNPIEPLYLFPFRSLKEVKIIKGGNLVAHQTYVYLGEMTNFALINRVIYQRDCLGHATNVYRNDPRTGQNRTIYRADWQGANAWPGDLKLSETDETGVVKTFTYDSLERTRTVTKKGLSAGGYPAQIDITQTLAYDAAGRVLTNTTSGGSLSLSTVSRFDKAGHLKSETSPEGFTSTNVYELGGRRIITTTSAQTTKVVENYFDRRVASITGTAVTNQFFDYSLSEAGLHDRLCEKNVISIINGTEQSLRWTATVTDKRNVLADEWKPAFRGESVIKRHRRFEVDGIVKAIYDTGFIQEGDDLVYDPNAIVHIPDYNSLADQCGEGQDGQDADVEVDFDYYGIPSTDRVTAFHKYYETDGLGRWLKVSEKLTYPTDADDTPVLVERTKERLTGFASTEISETLSYDADTNLTKVLVTVDLANKKVSTLTTVAQSSLTATNVSLNGLAQTESTVTVAAPTRHYYDALGRETAQVSPLGFASGTTYNSTTGQVIAQTNLAGQVTTLQYYQANGTNAGLLYCQTGPTGKKTYYNYNGWGQVTHIWGDTPYPERRIYNVFGDLVTNLTYRTGTEWTSVSWPSPEPSGDATIYQYDEPTGLLTNKVDALGRHVAFDYYPNHYPKARYSARGWVSTNYYTPNGDLGQVDYATNDVVKASVVYTNYNRFGQPRLIADESGEHELTYDHAARLVSDRCVSGLLNGALVTNRFKPGVGKDLVRTEAGGRTLESVNGFDSYGRLQSVGGDTNLNINLWIDRVPDSDLPRFSQSCSQMWDPGVDTERTWDYGYRLRSIRNYRFIGGVSTNLSGHAYEYDLLDRRTHATLSVGWTWTYGYNDRNEVTLGKHYWPDQTPVAGQQFEYAFDPIGNRIQAKEGGDTYGFGLRTEPYVPNALNQYSGRTNSDRNEVVGMAYTPAYVTVNENAAHRTGDYFEYALPGGASDAPAYQAVVNLSYMGGNYETNTGALMLPPINQSFVYDLDGNLINDGLWSYEWNGDNRLVRMTSLLGSGAPNVARKQLEFRYDYQGRRVVKTVSTWNGGGYGNSVTNKFVYDLAGSQPGGGNLLAELDGAGNMIRSYLWGPDLSGTLDGAGGIGGLIRVQEYLPEGQLPRCAGYDGNGNVVILAAGTSEPMRYEYGPYGELIRGCGPTNMTNPFRFATKYWDSETDLVYFGQRYYSPSLGRFLSPDPIGTDGGPNLYAFVGNNPINQIDPLGQFALLDTLFTESAQFTEKTAELARGGTIVRRVRDVVHKLNSIEDFTDGVMLAQNWTGADMDAMLIRLNEAKATIAQGMRGPKSVATARHHLLPKAPRFAALFMNNDVNIHAITARLPAEFHYVFHGKGGGAWNNIWDEFSKQYNPQKRPFFVAGFGFGLLQRLGLGNAKVFLYR